MKITCPICGRIDDPEEYMPGEIRSIMEEKKCCFHCAFWYSHVGGDPDMEDPSEIVIIGHSHYSFPKLEPIHMSTGYTWPRTIPIVHYILFFDGRVIMTNQLWHQGSIPEFFWNILPNNAVFINREDYDRILSHKDTTIVDNSRVCPKHLLNYFMKKYNI